MLDNFLVKLFATENISNTEVIERFFRVCEIFIGVSGWNGEWTRDGDEKVHRFEEIEALLKGGWPEWTGRLMIVFGDDTNQVSGAIELMQLPIKKRHLPSGDIANYQCHIFTLEISHSIANSLGERKIFDFLCALAEVCKVNLAVANLDDGFEKSLNQSHGLESGLPGVYDMMVLGPCFTELIGRSKLVQYAFPEARWMGDKIFAFQATNKVFDANEINRNADKSRIKSELGADYFSTISTESQLGSGGQMNLLSFIRDVIKIKRNIDSGVQMARYRPKIDWSGVFKYVK